MSAKYEFLLLFLQLWHFAIPYRTLQTLLQFDINKTNSSVQKSNAVNSNFSYQFGKKVYHIEKNVNVNWYQASNVCRQLGGHLWNIESSDEMDAILAIAIAHNPYWTSGNCLAKSYVWISATTGYPMPYRRWLPGEPNNSMGDEYCIEARRNGLNDVGCLQKKHYICEAIYM